jgi:hypothetical protein
LASWRRRWPTCPPIPTSSAEFRPEGTCRPAYAPSGCPTCCCAQAGHVTAVLDLLAEADVGGYDAIPGGQQGRANDRHHLYVDMMQYHRAQDVLMLLLRGKSSATRWRRDGREGTEHDKFDSGIPLECDRGGDQAADHERRYPQGDLGADSRRADGPGTGRRLLHRLLLPPHGAPRPAPRTGGDPMRNLIQVPRRRVIAAVVVLAMTVILAVILAVLGVPSWWLLLLMGLVVFFSLVDPDNESSGG